MKIEKKEIEKINVTALAYIGDSVYEVFVREHALESGNLHSDELHRLSVKYVCAEGQSKALKALMDGFLTEEENRIARHARNHKLAASKKNSKKDMMTDKYATAFEALIGYLHLSGERDRLIAIIEKTFEIIEGKTNEKDQIKDGSAHI